MSSSKQLAQQFRDMHFGPSFVGSYLKEHVTDLSWEQATTSVHGLNSIATLVFHINYYVAGVLEVLRGGDLTISDKYSFNAPPISSQTDWENLLNKTWADAEAFALLVEQLTETQLNGPMADAKYGSYLKNLVGMQEHSYYHIGQIALIRRMVLEKELS